LTGASVNRFERGEVYRVLAEPTAEDVNGERNVTGP
jgi:hypothetical protein